MNRKHIDDPNLTEQQNGQYAVARNRKFDVVAALICLLLAVLAWLVFMNRTESDYVELVVAEPQAGYVYELSVTQVEIEGSVTALRDVTEIKINLPAPVEGKQVYTLCEANLELPEGIVLSKALTLTVTVTKAP